MAIAERRPGPGVIHHSDQGVQYASLEYVEELRRHGSVISMARRDNPYENATIEDVVLRLPHFIEEVYIRKRLHSALGYLPPEDYEKSLLQHDNQREPSRTLLTLSVQ